MTGEFCTAHSLCSGGFGKGQLIYPVDLAEQPAMPIRWVDEWDNADGSIERGYAGRSIFFEGGQSPRRSSTGRRIRAPARFRRHQRLQREQRE